MIKKAVRDIIVDDDVADDLATYTFTTGSAATPAVFTSRVVPEDAEFPCVHVRIVTTAPWGTRDKKGAEVLADVQLMGEKNQSDKGLEEIAIALWLALDRATLTVSGYDVAGCIASPPLQTSADSAYPAYTIQVRAFLTQS